MRSTDDHYYWKQRITKMVDQFAATHTVHNNLLMEMFEIDEAERICMARKERKVSKIQIPQSLYAYVCLCKKNHKHTEENMKKDSFHNQHFHIS